MKRPSFFHGVIVAAVLGFFASAIVATLTPFVGIGAVVRLVIPGLALAYILYLFSRCDERVGRATTLSLWTVVTVATWWFAPALPLYMLIHVGVVWLVRSLYFYSGIMPALMDLGLSGLSVSAATWAITRSGSVFLATWCFFLVQSLFVTIPPSVRRTRPAETDAPIENDSFEQARRRADAAVRQLITQ